MKRLSSRLVLLVSAISLLMCASYAQEKQEKKKGRRPSQKELEKLSRKATIHPPSGADFYIAPIAAIPGRFSLVLSDFDGRFVSDSFGEEQIMILEAIMVEARKFAQTDEAAGTTKPVITRFYDKKEPAFIVDVAKLRDRSQFFITIKSLTGHLTVDAGTIKRGDEKASPFFYTILSRVQARGTASSK